MKLIAKQLSNWWVRTTARSVRLQADVNVISANVFSHAAVASKYSTKKAHSREDEKYILKIEVTKSKKRLILGGEGI